MKRVSTSFGLIAIFLGVGGMSTACSSRQKRNPISESQVLKFELVDAPLLAPESQIRLGGFSGLWFEGEKNGELVFWTHTDRGPNGKSSTRDDGKEIRPFALPRYQPELIELRLNLAARTLRVGERIGLVYPKGKAATGLPNRSVRVTREKRFGFSIRERKQVDEIPVDFTGLEIKPDPLGIDPEGLCRDSQGFFWMVEEYLPSILKVNSKGVIQKRYIPELAMTKSERQQVIRELGTEIFISILPEFLNERKLNRGFEGVACTEEAVYAILQSPFDDSGLIPLIEFDPKMEEVRSVLRYPSSEKIGDLARYKMNLLVIEQNSEVGVASKKWLYSVNPYARGLPLEKKLILDLAKLGFSEFEKLEGLAVLGKIDSLKPFLPRARNTAAQDVKVHEDEFIWIAVVNDNDFGLAEHATVSVGQSTLGQSILNPNSKTVLGLIPIPLKSFNE